MTLMLSFPLNIIQTNASEKKTIRVTTDPRIELITVVQLIVGYWPMCRFDIEYMQKVYEQFGQFYDHPVMRQYAMMWFMHGFTDEIPHALMLHLSPPPELQVKTNIPKTIIDKAGGEKKLNDFLDLLRDFAKKSRFKSFYDFNEVFYQNHIKKVATFIADKSYIETLESFFGPNRFSYAIILSPLTHEKGYGVNVGSHLYSIVGPSDSFEREPIFDEPEELSYQIYHDFSQSFIHPLTSRNRELVVTHRKLYQPIWREMMNQRYYSWEASFNEHLIRTVITWINFNTAPKEVAEKMHEENYFQGFIYSDYLYELILYYTANRDVFPQFTDFFPHVLDAFDYLCELPYAPAYLTAAFVSANGVQLEWLDQSYDELGFLVYRRESIDADFELISELLPQNQSFYRDENVLSGQRYEYRISALGSKGEIFTNRCTVVIPKKAPLSPRNITWQYDHEEKLLKIEWKYSFMVDGFKLYQLDGEKKLLKTFESDNRSYEFELEKSGIYRFVLTSYINDNETILESVHSPIIEVMIN